MLRLSPDLMLKAYAAGIFPMAESAESPELYWFDPESRGILPLESFHVGRRLRRSIRQQRWRIAIDRDFVAVVQACAEPTADRPQTWINAEILEVYSALHRRGFAHSVELWDGEDLVGGLYGVRMGAAFFGESMFSRVRDASKIALVHLAARLWSGGFSLLDTQFVTPHLAQFGAIAIPRAVYRQRLRKALAQPADFLQPEREEMEIMDRFLAAIRREDDEAG